MRRVIVLGSTGSIGTQALDVIRANPERFEVVGLSAFSRAEEMRAQAAEFEVEHVAVGAAEAEQLVADVEADVVLNGITGSVGLGPTLAALSAGRTLANSSPGSPCPVRSSPSIPSTPRSRRHSAAAPPQRCVGSS